MVTSKVIPMLPITKPLFGSAQNAYTSLQIHVFPYGLIGGSYYLYEDDGVTTDYQDSVFSNTSITYEH